MDKRIERNEQAVKKYKCAWMNIHIQGEYSYKCRCTW